MIKGGPKIINDSLVACLDAHDAKSYAGEPTQNYVINTTSTGGWWGDGSSQTGLGSKGAVAITDENLKYNGYDTVLWTPGTSRNCYLNGSADIPTSETSTEWTFSAYVKYEDGSTISSMSVYMYYPSSDGSSAGTVTDVGGGWYRVRRTRTGSSNYISLAGFADISAMKKIYISGWQLEKKQYTTPVTSPATSRSATDGWKDLSTNDHDGSLLNGTNTGVNYYRDGQVIMPVANSYLDFDGSDDYITISSLLNQETINGSTTKTIILWLKADSYGARIAFSTGQNGNNRIYYWTQNSLNTWRIGDYVSTSGHSALPSAGTWFCTAIVINGLSVTGYLNGTQDYTGAYSAFTTQDYAVLGRHGTGSYYYDGKIGKVSVYNNALTAAEVLSNYNATKNRFT